MATSKRKRKIPATTPEEGKRIIDLLDDAIEPSNDSLVGAAVRAFGR
jgi:hypothetical protein